ncbi:Uncharacterized protein PBTT_03521 [Plasmodiophora brassicae]
MAPGSRGDGSKAAIAALRALQARLEELEADRERAFERTRDAQQSTSSELVALRDKYERNVEDLQAELDACRRRLEAERRAHAKQISELREQIVRMARDTQQATDALDVANEKLSRVRVDVTTMTEAAPRPWTARSRLSKAKTRRAKAARPSVPFIPGGARSKSHSLTATVQSALATASKKGTTDEETARKLSDLLASVDLAMSQLNRAVQRRIDKARRRSRSPDAQRSYENKVRMLSILRQYKADVFGEEQPCL